MWFGKKSERIKNTQTRAEAAAHMHTPRENANLDVIERGSKAYDRIFKIQTNIEAKGHMDYRAYARDMWQFVTGTPPDDKNPNYLALEGGIIANLHDIPMEELVYPHVVESVAGLIKEYRDSIAHISLWSTGDVESTAYQSAKIYSSEIVQKFRQALITQLGPKEGRRMLQENTRWEVADNKFKNLVAYMGAVLAANDGPVKVIIIEDSVKNFTTARTYFDQAFGSDSERIKIIPIWATYSREGQQAKEKSKTSGTEPQFEETVRGLNGIASFSELLDTQRFGEILKDAHVFVDFDGVIGDNLRMRDAQASAILSAAVDALSHEWNTDRATAKTRILEKLSS